MAMKLSLLGSLPKLSSRALSAQAAVKTAPAAAQRLPCEELKTTTLENGLTIHSQENHSPVSRVVIVTKAGARYEDSSNRGLSHVLRNSAGLTTANSSTFAITKNIEWVGGNMYASATRDHMIYTLECNRDYVATAVKLLNDTVFANSFRSWELEDSLPRLKMELGAFAKNQGAQLMEALHQASFRGGLSHSLFIHPSQLGKIKSEQLKEFCQNHITGPRTVVSAMGVDHERFVHMYKSLTDLRSSSADEGKASRFNPNGGEVRLEFGAPNAMLALAMESCAGGLANAKDAHTMEVLKHVLGMSKARVPFSVLEATRLGKAALASKPSSPFSIGAFTANYSDCGMFGVAMAAHPKEVGNIAKAAVAAVRDVGKGNVQDAELSAAKAKAKYAVAKRMSKDTKIARNTAIQQLTQGAPQTYAEAEAIIDSISKQDLLNVAQKMSRVKPSMAVVGKLHDVPHLDEILQ